MQLPSELLYGRNLKTKLDLVKFEPTNAFRNTALQPSCDKLFKLGARVQSQNYSISVLWKYGRVVEPLGRFHYLTEQCDGYIIKIHVDQLRQCQINRYFSTLHVTPRRKLLATFSDYAKHKETNRSTTSVVIQTVTVPTSTTRP